MQLLGRAKFLMEDENPKGKVKFLKGGEFPKGGGEFPKGGGEFPRNFAPREGDIPRNFAPLGGEIVGGRNSWDTGLVSPPIFLDLKLFGYCPFKSKKFEFTRVCMIILFWWSWCPGCIENHSHLSVLLLVQDCPKTII